MRGNYLLVGSTIGLGWFSLLVDVLLAWIKSKFAEGKIWDRAVLLEGLGILIDYQALAQNP